MNYVICDNHTIGIQRGNSVEVLRQLISKGGGFEVCPEPKDVSQFDEIREANVEDFFSFRVYPPPDLK